MVEGLLFEAATKADDGYIYAVSSRYNALYKIDSNNRATYIGNLWMEQYNRKRLSFSTQKWNIVVVLRYKKTSD